MAAEKQPDTAPAGWRHRLGPVFRWAERLFWVGAAVWIAVRLAPQLSAWTGIAADDRPAPAVAVTTLDGRVLGNAELEGRVVVLSFWATWCLPCRVEMPALQSLHERYAEDGLVVLGLATDAHDRSAVDAFLEERGITFPIAAATNQVRIDYGGVDRLPTTVVIDRSGRIRHEVVGLFAPPALGATVRRLLREDDERGQ